MAVRKVYRERAIEGAVATAQSCVGRLAGPPRQEPGVLVSTAQTCPTTATRRCCWNWPIGSSRVSAGNWSALHEDDAMSRKLVNTICRTFPGAEVSDPWGGG